MFKMIDGLENHAHVRDDEPTESKEAAEVTKQRKHIKRLQSAVEDQSRLPQEWEPTDSSVHNETFL